MALEIKEISKSQVEITAEISADDFERAYAHTLERYNKELNIPGFRPGHVPEHILREKVGEGALLQDAAEDAIQAWYQKIISEKKIEAIGHPQASITKMARNNPLGVKIVTAVLPAIALPDYKAIAREIMEKKDAIVVEEKEIDDTLEYLKSSKLKNKNSSSKTGPPPSAVPAQARQEEKPEAHNSPSSGETQNDMPIDDAFAKSFGNFKTLAEFRETIRANITLEKEAKKKEEKRMAVLERIAAQIRVDIPDVMLSAEKEKMIGELRSSIENMGMKWDDYTAHVKKTEEEMKSGWDDQARKRVLFGLILRTLSKEENISIDDKELDVFVESLKQQYGYEHTDAHALKHLREYAYGLLKNEKVFQILEHTDTADKKE